MEIRKLPVGIDSFEKLRKENFYYVDKTGLIADILRNWGEVNLFTRPRRFGKTLNMNMLKSFFEIGADPTLFDGLAISKEKELCDAYMGKYPVVFVSLKGVDGLDFEAAYDSLRQVITQEASRHQYLLNSDVISDADKIPLRALLERTDSMADIKDSLRMLTSLLEKHYGQKVILLVDEYDVPLDKAYTNKYYDKMIDIIRSMFNAAMKTNSSLQFAILTGCLRVSKESIFTGLNNPKVRSISDVKFDEYFGFTDDEVKKLLADYGLENHYDQACEWYDGYLFGEQNIYCPWDVINFCDDLLDDPNAEPKAYWSHTSGNDMVRMLIEEVKDGMTQLEIERLIAGETITKSLNEQLTHSEIRKNVNNVWSLLYMTGYLTITQRPSGGRYVLRIPNREICQIYKEQVRQWFEDVATAETDKLTELYTAFETGNTRAITEYLDEQLLHTISFYDAKESFYHGFLLALLNTCTNWRVSSNAETGKGRSDIIAYRMDRKVGFVVEVKDVKSADKLETAMENAIKQIEDKDYTAFLRNNRIQEIWEYGIAFCDKECRVEGKRINSNSGC